MRFRSTLFGGLYWITYWGLLNICLFVKSDWTLTDMGKSYFDVSVKAKVVDKMDSANYIPVKKGQLCKDHGDFFKLCSNKSSDSIRRILVVDQLPVMATQLGCGKRMYHLLEGIVGLGIEVSLAYIRPDSHEADEDRSLMTRLGVPVLRSPLLVRDVKDDYKKLLEETQPDVIIMTLWYWQTDKPWFNAPGLFMSFTRKAMPHTTVLILSDDVHWLRLQKLSMSSQLLSSTSSRHGISLEAEIAAIRVSEYQNYNEADAVLTISDTDRKNVMRYDTSMEQGLKNKGKVFTVPFVASPWETQQAHTLPPFEHRRGLIFVGNMDNPTNIEGLHWFIETILPRLADRIPELSFTIVGGGKWPLPNPPVAPVRYLGWLSWEQMRQELNSARVFISPIVVSTGVNTKNSLAMSNGIPLVTTKIGASGLCYRCDDYPVSVDVALDSVLYEGIYYGTMRRSPFIAAADDAEFLRGVLELYNDKVIWTAYSKAGIDNARDYLSVKSGTQALEEAIIFAKKSHSGSSTSNNNNNNNNGNGNGISKAKL
eukprot:gene1224-2378_t